MKRTFAMLTVPGTFQGTAATPPAGRLVANSELFKAVVRHGSFDRFCFFIGENGDRADVEALATAAGMGERLEVRHLLDLPRAFTAGEISVVHHASHVERFWDLVWLRDRFATPGQPAIPVTGQIHSLSYPDLVKDYLRALLHPPGPHDAIFCSSAAGQRALWRSFDEAAAALRRIGAVVRSPSFAAPVVPLGVDVDHLRGGDRGAARSRLGIGADELVILGLGRFSEYDKMDLFPLLQVFARVVARRGPAAPRLRLLLAGARQGTQTPRMAELWAQALGVGAAVTLHIDFADAEKPDLLAAADLFVSPCDNLQETFGLSVIEAMAAGLAVIVSDFDGYKDTVTADVGVRVPTRWSGDLDRLSDLGPILYLRPLHLFLGQSVEVDLTAFEQALFDLCADGARRARLGAAALARARQLYDWRAVIPGYEAVWAALGSQPFAARPETPARHPAALRFADVFAHYPTELIDPARAVQQTALGAAFARNPGGYVIYPELRAVFGADDAAAALAAAAAPTTVGQVIAAAVPRWPKGEAWRAQALATWLLKHGLLAPTDASR